MIAFLVITEKYFRFRLKETLTRKICTTHFQCFCYFNYLCVPFACTCAMCTLHYAHIIYIMHTLNTSVTSTLYLSDFFRIRWKLRKFAFF